LCKGRGVIVKTEIYRSKSATNCKIYGVFKGIYRMKCRGGGPKIARSAYIFLPPPLEAPMGGG